METMPEGDAALGEQESGPAYGPFQRWVALIMGAVLLAWFLMQLNAGTLGKQWPLWAAALAIVEITSFWVWRSRITVNADSIVQTWIWRKEAKKPMITSATLFYIPALAWLLAPRLIVRTSNMRVTAFNVADLRVIAFVRKHYLPSR